MRNPCQRFLLALASLALPVLFVLLPILAFIATSFWKLVDGQVVREFTVANYAAFFTESGFLDVYGSTILLCLQVTLLNLLIAVIVALFIGRRSERTRFALMMAFMLPLFMSYIIKIYSLRGLLGQRGMLNEMLIGAGLIDQPLSGLLFSPTAIFVTLVVIYLPYAVLPIYLSIEGIPRNIIEASADLGGSTADEIFRVVLPLCAPGMAVAAVFTFVLTFGDFITPQMVGGTDGFTFGRIVQSQFGLALDWPQGAALAVIMLVTTLAAVGLAGLAARRVDR